MNKLSHKEQIVKLLMSDRQWHSNFEFNEKVCLRYTARIGELKEDGFNIEKRQIDQQRFEWRLITPNQWINPFTYKLKPVSERVTKQGEMF